MKERIDITLTRWQDCYAGAYKTLGLEWLDKYSLTEAVDYPVLENPKAAILKKGGMIWFALCDGEAVGTISLLPLSDSVWELIKFGVTEKYQGKGIGEFLLKTALCYAREQNAAKVVLETNSVLASAIAMYRRNGFQDVPLGESEFATADTRMELNLKP